MHNSFQIKFFEDILEKFPKKSQAVDELSDLLKVGKDAVYRRLRGDTVLTPDELTILAKHFRISIDHYIFDNSDTVFFTFNSLSNEVRNFSDFFQQVLTDLRTIHKEKGAEVFYATSEIPIFFYCFYPEIIQFKLYLWARTIWDMEYVKNNPFDFDLIAFPIMQATEELVKLYRHIPSTELWSLNIVDNTLSQIEYYVNSGNFRQPNDAIILCDKLIELINHVRNMAKYGRKFLPNGSNESGGEFHLYFNELVYTSNTIIVSMPTSNAIYTSFGNPNFLKSTDQRLCNYAFNWIKKVISKAESISTHAEKIRDTYFNRMVRKVELCKGRIENYILALE